MSRAAERNPTKNYWCARGSAIVFVAAGRFTGVLFTVLLFPVAVVFVVGLAVADVLLGVFVDVVFLSVVGLLLVVAVDFAGVLALLFVFVVSALFTLAFTGAELVAEEIVALALGAASVAEAGTSTGKLSCNGAGGGFIIAWYSFFGSGTHWARK